MNLQEIRNRAAKIIFLFFIVLSVIIFIVGVSSLIVNLNKAKNCTEEVVATCTQIRKRNKSGRSHRGYRNTMYTPVFTYEYNNKKYEIKYGRSYSEKYKNTFDLNKEYTIYVNPKFPSQFIVEGHEDDIDTLAIGGTIVGAALTILYSVIYFIYRAVIIKKYEKERAI